TPARGPRVRRGLFRAAPGTPAGSRPQSVPTARRSRQQQGPTAAIASKRAARPPLPPAELQHHLVTQLGRSGNGRTGSPGKAITTRYVVLVKVVLFCGGLGMRIREDSERLPKPMIPVGDRPILLHIMRYFAAFGHKDFIVCLGYKAEAIKDYFLNYNEALSNDFILTDGGRSIELLQRDIDEWSITFVSTGLQATIGERLKAVAPHLEGEEVFLANYGDVLTDAPLRDMEQTLTDSDAVVLFLAPRPTHTFHIVSFDG